MFGIGRKVACYHFNDSSFNDSSVKTYRRNSRNSAVSRVLKIRVKAQSVIVILRASLIRPDVFGRSVTG